MKFNLLLCVGFILSTGMNEILAQTKTITYQELPDAVGAPTGSGMFLGASMTASDITVTFSGPSDRWFALGLGSLMSPTDVLIYSGGKAGATHPVDWFDYYNISTTAAGINKDLTQNWTITSNTVLSGVRTVIASRVLNTGDANDLALLYSAANLNVVWARGATASYTIANHGTTNRRAGIVLPWIMPDVTAPTLAVSSALSPADNATGVALGTNMTATFSENIQFGTGLVSLYLSTGVLVESFDVASSSNVSISGTTLTINPTSNLLSLTDYYLQIAPTAIKDMANNAYAGITNNSSWNFTTLDNSSDVTAPLLDVTPFVPADNSLTASVSNDFQVNFNEDVMLGTAGLITLKLSNGTTVETFDVSSSTLLSVNGPTVTINPTANLSYSTSYYCTIDNAAIVDLALNPYVGFTDNATWNFQTEADPSAAIGELEQQSYVQVIEKNLFIKVETKDFSVKIYDTQGRLVSDTKNQTIIDLSKEKNGIYLINVMLENQLIQTRILLN
jgi:methionine-rich copper-binding protein CopC